MPDNDSMKPGADLLNEQASNIGSDRANRISSLHRTVDDLVQEQNKKRLQISSEISSLTKQQQKTRNQLELERGEMTSETASGYSNVLKGLGNTINSLATGVKNITTDTGKATTDAIGQYGKAIGEDININKTNTIAMALSRATPLFGYFAAKFMETDVFRGAAVKIRDGVGSAMKEGLTKAGSGIANIFRKGKEVVQEEKEREPATVSDLEKLQRTIEGAPPKLQEGGYIKEGGMVQVHAAEVVTPIDKLLEQIDQAKSADISRKLDKTLSLMSQNLMRLETVVVERDEQKRGVIQTFIKEFQSVRDTRQESHQRRLLKAILELKVGLIGMTSRMRIAWQRTLLQHPTFRNMLMFSELMQSAIMSPIRFLFGVRGGYAGDVRRASSTHNVFGKVSNLLALTYTTLMPKIDDLVIYSKAAAEGITGETITPSKEYTYTAFGKIKEFMTTRSIDTEGMFGALVDKLGLDKEALADAGVTGFKGFTHPTDIAEKMGVTKTNILGKFLDKEKPDVFTKLFDNISWLRKMKEDQEAREGPHSPSMAENIASTASLAEVDEKKQTKYQKIKESLQGKANRFAKDNLKETKGMKRKLKGWGNKIWDIMLIAAGFLKDIMGGAISKITGFFAPLLSFFGISKAGKMIKGFFGKGASGAATRGAGKTGAKGLVGKGLGVLGKGAKFGGKLLGRVAGVGIGGAIGMGMGAWDAIQAMRDPEGFVGNFLQRGLAGFLGGTDSGMKGVTSGAFKGGGIGAAVGAVGGPIGILLGGAVGALAGGLLGFVGGKNISKAISATTAGIKKLAKGVWNVVTFPVKMLKEGLKSVWVLTKWGFKMTFGKVWTKIKEWWEKPGIIQTALKFWTDLGSRALKQMMRPFKWLGEKIANIFDGDLWNQAWVGIKDTFKNMFASIKAGIAKKISEIPYIGAIFKGIKGVVGIVKDIHEGNLANKLESALDTIDRPKKIPTVKTPPTLTPVSSSVAAAYSNPASDKKSKLPSDQGSSLTRLQRRRLRREEHQQRLIRMREHTGEFSLHKAIQAPSSLVEKYSKYHGGRDGVKEKEYEPQRGALEKTIGTDVKKQSLEQEARAKSTDKLSKQMGTKIEKGSKQTTAAVIQNTNVLASTSSNNNVVSGGGGGMPGGSSFSSGNQFAADVTRCNIS